MTELSKRILQIIKERNGIKAIEIAKILGCDRKTVNSALYSSKELKNLCWQDASYKWYSIGAEKVVENKPEKQVDEKLNNICKYYLSCLNSETNNGISAFLTSQFDLEYVEIDGLNEDAFQKENVINYLNKRTNNKTTVSYMGYPILIDKLISKNNTEYYKIYPVFLFPVEYSHGKVSVSEFPTINIDLIKKYSNNNLQESIYEQIQLEEELGLNEENDEILIDELVNRLKEIRLWDWKEELNPDEINIEIPLNELNDEVGIFNRAVIMSCEKSPYTAGLESELSELMRLSTDEIKDTALYDWLYEDVSNDNNDVSDNLLEVLPLNSEQYDAVNTALNKKLTIVTGPPGTGKSQVVTNILVNMAYNKKSVLFSSKNNQAVDVVNARVNSLAKKPVILKVGSTKVANYLAELIENLLASTNNNDEISDYEYDKKRYEEKINLKVEINNKIKSIYFIRNRLDQIEQKVCLIDEDLRKKYDLISEELIDNVKKLYNEYCDAYLDANKEVQSIFIKILWKWLKEEREEKFDGVTKNINEFLKIYNIVLTDKIDTITYEKQKKLISKFLEDMLLLLRYKKLQEDIKKSETIEELQFKLYDINKDLSDIAINLWRDWLQYENNEISNEDRKLMSEYVAAINLLDDVDVENNDGIKKKFPSLQKKMARYFPCWSVTALSAKNRVPFKAGMFDLLVIDEASQCDIASILPLLFRSKRAVIIGDPKQLTHITSVTKKHDLKYLNANNINVLWSYSQCSLYSLASSIVNSKNIIHLRDHHRSCAEIIGFSNEEFYDEKLRIATDYKKLNPPKVYNLGMRWIDVNGTCIKPNNGSAYNQKEIDTIIEELKKLVDNEYDGSIGVVTPFRVQAEKIRETIEKDRNLDNILHSKNRIIIDTVHKFQGDEKDLIFFSPVISNNASAGSINFLSNTGNLFNVAITRAKSTLIVVGNKSYCLECPVRYMNNFVKYCDRIKNREEKNVGLDYGNTREYPYVKNEEQVSEWEKIFYTELFDAGIKTIPQYPIDKYVLDFAIIHNNKKLDIEVDGAMYHRDWNGELCYRDQLRNNRLKELGWDVKRFWVQQIRDEKQWCIEEIKKWIAENNVGD